MRYIKLVLLLSLSLLTSCFDNSGDSNRGGNIGSFESTEIGNGGDLVECRQQLPQFPYPDEDGWYVLDYVENRGPKYIYFSDTTIKEHLSRIRSLIDFAAPELVANFDNYLTGIPFVSYFREGEETEIGDILRAWIPIEKNEEINDENPSYIPFNCRMSNSRDIKLHQVVVRREFTNTEGELGRIDYYYDQMLVDKIGNKDLQLSMLVVHEWLWDFYKSDQSRLLREANRMLHSPRSVELPKGAIRKLLNLDQSQPGNPKLPPKKPKNL